MNLPLLDFDALNAGDASRTEKFVRDLDAACRMHGFFCLINHGIDFAPAFAAAKTFFDLPLSEKEKIAITRSSCHRGWFRHGEEVLDPHHNPQGDYKEGIKIGNDCDRHHPRVKAGLPLHGPNQWPAIAQWKPTMQACYDACVHVGRRLMHAFARALDAPPDYFDRWLSDPMATLSPLRYPPQYHTQIGAGAHTDFGCLTLLAQYDAPGLQIETAPDAWIDIPFISDAVIINIGDMMARWSNDRYCSTRHRVINRSGRVRHSMAFFFDPDPEADLSALPNCIAPGEVPHYPPATCLEHLLHKIDESFSYMKEPS